MTTDYNLLFFDKDGNFLGSAADNNPLSGRPIELADMSGDGDEVQIVVARATTPASGTQTADHIRYVMFGGWLVDKFGVPWMVNTIPAAGWKPPKG